MGVFVYQALKYQGGNNNRAAAEALG